MQTNSRSPQSGTRKKVSEMTEEELQKREKAIAGRRDAAARHLAAGLHPDTLLPIEPHVTLLTGRSKATIYRLAQRDPFPKLIRLSSRCTRIRAGDLLDWLKSQGEA